MLVESRLYAGKEHIHSLLSLGAGHLVGDVQQVDNRILEVVSFDGLYPLLLLLFVDRRCTPHGLLSPLLHTHGSLSKHPLNA